MSHLIKIGDKRYSEVHKPRERLLRLIAREAAAVASVDGETVTEHEWQAQRRHRNLFRAVYRRTHPRLRRGDITVTDERLVRRAVKAAALGNAMEWFDFGIYSYLAVTPRRPGYPRSLTHLGEQDASLLMLMAKSRHKKPEKRPPLFQALP
jgi:hypothetical protein